MSTINGANQKTFEDLLLSIRSSVDGSAIEIEQETSSQDTAVRRVGGHRDGGFSDDNSEFELPAIFKAGHQHHSEKPINLLGRLSEALKPAAASEGERSRTVVRFEPAGGRMIEPPKINGTASKEDAIDQVNRVARENASQKREMPTFFDTRISRLGESARKVEAKAVENEKDPSPVPTALALPPQPPPLRHPMRVSAAEAAGAGKLVATGLDDATAQLLQPILKQWIAENMPKLLEKALRQETEAEFPTVGER